MIFIPAAPAKPEIVSTIEANLATRLAYLSQAPQAALYQGEEIAHFRTDIAYPNYLFNIVYQSRFKTVESIYSHIDEVLIDARQRHAPVFWSVAPSAQPSNLGMYLESHDFEHKMALQGMVLDIEMMNANLDPIPGFSVQRVRTAEQLRQFVDILATNSHMPQPITEAWYELEQNLGIDQQWPRQRFLGFLNGKPVATCTLMIGANVAGLYHVATLPEARGQGIGSAISLAAVQVAQVLGFQQSVLISSPMGNNVYRRLGFQPVDEFNIYYWSEDDNHA